MSNLYLKINASDIKQLYTFYRLYPAEPPSLS